MHNIYAPHAAILKRETFLQHTEWISKRCLRYQEYNVSMFRVV